MRRIEPFGHICSTTLNNLSTLRSNVEEKIECKIESFGQGLVCKTTVKVCALLHRGAGMGFLQIACRSGSGLAPWATKWLSVVDVVLPFSVMGSSAVIGSLLLYWLPETAHMETNEMLHDQFSENTNDQFSYRQVDEDGERTLMIKSDRTVVYTKEKWFLVKKYDTGYIA